MPDPDGVLTPDEASKAAVDDYGQPLSKWKRAEMKRELENWNRSYRLIEPPPPPPTRVWVRVSLAPNSVVKLDKIGKALGEDKRGRVFDKLVEHWISTHKDKNVEDAEDED